jgi:hypothetical protein
VKSALPVTTERRKKGFKVHWYPAKANPSLQENYFSTRNVMDPLDQPPATSSFDRNTQIGILQRLWSLDTSTAKAIWIKKENSLGSFFNFYI